MSAGQRLGVAAGTASERAGSAGHVRSAWTTGPIAQPKPLPKRPKGRILIGGLLIAALGALAYAVWDGFFRYEAYGTVEGRVIRVATPADGIVRSIHVREGDIVRQGQPLATLENPQREEDLARVADELRIAQATLEAELAKLRWNLQVEGDRRHKALAELYELSGTLAQEKTRLSDMEQQLRRLELLRQRNAAPDVDYETTRLAELGQRGKVEKLSSAVSHLQDRAELTSSQPERDYGQLRPILAQIESLQDQMRRIRDSLQQCELRSPVHGVVLKGYYFTGEHAEESETVFEILEDDSLEAVVYYPQDRASSLDVGSRLPLVISPTSSLVHGIVTRLGSQLVPAPDPVRRFYNKDQRLLAVHVKPECSADARSKLRLGSVVRVPYFRWDSPDEGPGTSNDRQRATGQRGGTRGYGL